MVDIKTKINWYPGHIARARREIGERLKDIDLIIEIIDARCILSSINFFYEKIKNKKRLVVINKIDLVSEKELKESEAFKKLVSDNNIDYIFLDSRNNDIKKLIDKKVDNLTKDIIEKSENKGIKKTLLKAMVIGMPNVGKSTFINSYVKKKVNKVENTPGVTKRLQWAKISDKILLLDTPGITVPKFSDDNIGLNLALVGSLNDDIFEKQDLVYEFIEKVKSRYFDFFRARYKLVDTNVDKETIDIMNEIAMKNGCLKKGGEVNYDKVSNMILTDFRKGILGKILLDY